MGLISATTRPLGSTNATSFFTDSVKNQSSVAPSGFFRGTVLPLASAAARQVSSLWKTPIRVPALAKALPALAASAALFVTGCDNGTSGNSGGSNTNTNPPAPPTVYIDVDNIGFYPVESWAEPGARVVFTNLACDDFDGDSWCDWDEEFDVDVEGETTSDSYGYDYFDTGYLNYNGSASFRLPSDLWAGDAYFLNAWYRYDSDWVDGGHATGWLNIE